MIMIIIIFYLYLYFYCYKKGSLDDQVSLDWKLQKIENSVFLHHIFAKEFARHKKDASTTSTMSTACLPKADSYFINLGRPRVKF